MTGIRFFVEGGGETNASGRADLRVAFDALLNPQKEAARKKRLSWTTTFCGGRKEAAREFCKALKRGLPEVVVLLVDAEDAVESVLDSRPTPHERVNHLLVRDGWENELDGCSPEHVHLMTPCMEAWVFADVDRVSAYYGNGFRPKSLPGRQPLDSVSKAELYKAIDAATHDTSKGRYGKVKHASAILKLVRPDVVASRCVSFGQFVQWLDATIASAV
jgi:hypothetical protein